MVVPSLVVECLAFVEEVVHRLVDIRHTLVIKALNHKSHPESYDLRMSFKLVLLMSACYAEYFPNL